LIAFSTSSCRIKGPFSFASTCSSVLMSRFSGQLAQL
jgi:hypothetical protein